MSSADFAAAQARLAARRQRIEEQNLARRREQEAAHALSNTRIPLPFRSISDAGLSVWDSIKGREGTRPAFRVGQVDAELLDDELLDLLKGQVSEALKYFGVSYFSHEDPEHCIDLDLGTSSDRLVSRNPPRPSRNFI
jgi:peroxin-2